MIPFRRTFCALGALVILAFPACRIETPSHATGDGRSPTRGHEDRALSIVPNLDDDDADGVSDGETSRLDGPGDRSDLLDLHVDAWSGAPSGSYATTHVDSAWRALARFFRGDPPAPVERIETGAIRAGFQVFLELADFGRAPNARDLTAWVTIHDSGGRFLREHRWRVRVAPFRLASSLDSVERVHVLRTPQTSRFVEQLDAALAGSGATLEVLERSDLPADDVWMQDAVEIGTVGEGERAIRLALHGNRGRALDRAFAERFLGPGTGVLRRGAFRGREARWIDWFGNLEVSPPVRAAGREFPHGRVYTGRQGSLGLHPEVLEFLESCGDQGPVLTLDTGWLRIGHVDEMVAWVPSRTGRPWRVLVPSPRLALDVLRRAEAKAPGGTINGRTHREEDRRRERTVASILADPALLAEQYEVERRIEGVRRSLARGLGLAPEDFVEIPALFHDGIALFPNMVNALVVGNRFLCADPHGPLVNGEDVLLAAVRERLEPLGCAVVALDDFFPYHVWLGEVHCGTNTTRGPRGAATN